MYQQSASIKKPNIVVIGGGAGSFTLLRSLKDLTPNITALVNMADDGGSTGILRDELGVLPPGDVRQCLVALSRTSEMRELFNYRFSEGMFKGHSFGNLFLTALEKTTGSFATAVETASKVLNVRGTVLPITLDNVRLVLHHQDGTFTSGEHLIDVANFGATNMRPKLSLDPEATINPKAAKAIAEANVVVIAPGDLYTSLGSLLIVDGVAGALKTTRAKIVYVCNLVVKPGQTDGFSVFDHASEIERFAGPVLDYVLYNTASPPETLMQYYSKYHADLVFYDTKDFESAHYQAVGMPLVAKQPVLPHDSDVLASYRSVIRHNARAVAKFMISII
ncbi:MAG: gluconeogenesis factor YvcK family protein [Candidatus Saccharimonadales bacterium]